MISPWELKGRVLMEPLKVLTSNSNNINFIIIVWMLMRLMECDFSPDFLLSEDDEVGECSGESRCREWKQSGSPTLWIDASANSRDFQVSWCFCTIYCSSHVLVWFLRFCTSSRFKATKLHHLSHECFFVFFSLSAMFYVETFICRVWLLLLLLLSDCYELVKYCKYLHARFVLCVRVDHISNQPAPAVLRHLTSASRNETRTRMKSIWRICFW